MRAQVVIVGGGPVGMLLAAELGDYGVATVLLEARASVSERPKASVLHARALQGLARRGYFSELVPRAATATGETEAPFRFAGVPGLSLTAPASEPGPLLKRPQAELERLFEQRARAAGVRVLREHRVTGVSQDQDGVRVLADGPSGRVECTARYLVGADGGRSIVRELAGLTSQTYPATTSGLAGLVTLRDAADLPSGWHRTPRGWIVAREIPGDGTHIKTLDCSRAHPERHLPPTARELHDEISRIAGKEIAFSRPRWLSRFSDFAQLARSYRHGRVFLAGDAAHMHFPVGALGLSTGVQDALNLGWKLAFAVRGLAGEGLLDTYDAERRPAARSVIDNTRAQLALMRSGPEVDALNALFAQLVAADRGSRHLSDLISGQDMVLPPRTPCASPWEGRFLQNLALQTREGRTDVIGLLRAGRPLVLLFGENGGRHLPQARDWAQAVSTVHVEPTDRIPCDALLVRPDGYVAWASAPGGDSLEDALELYFGARPAPPVQQLAMTGAGAGVGVGVGAFS
ncbi:FAD-dependent monooxygenase [Streptomyces hilarionis]|uniref:FAD-dependent monooxygenase n=1 Tax=Streptomyces hilarionis TaxID=2839954 RepID=UPI0027E356B8|nr:FAD-dependent monooxygenase [Streptomyces hilarionis]